MAFRMNYLAALLISTRCFAGLVSTASVPASHTVRELNTDRPDKTESAYTVPKGWLQIESDLATYTRDHHTTDGTEVDAWGLGGINLKYGLLDNVDMQFLFDGYLHERSRDGLTGRKTSRNGVGDFTTRLKYNVWGNDGGSTALALMPFIKVPTANHGFGNGELEGGLIVPLAVALPAGWRLGLMTEVDIMANEDGTGGHHAEFINSISLAHDLTEKLGFYTEIWTLVSAEDSSAWEATLDFGLTYGLTNNIQLDCGCNFGLTRSAEDINPFVGLSIRF